MKTMLVLAIVLLVTACYWQPAEAPVLNVEYAGLFVSTVTNETTGSVLVSFGYQQQSIDTAEAFSGETIKRVTALVEKGSFGEYVDLGPLTAKLGDRMDVALLGDPRADLYWP